MIGVDTNVLIRFFETNDSAEQTAAARKLVHESAPIFINPIVLAEFAWTLRKIFKLDRAQICDRLQGVIVAPEFQTAYPEATRRAVEYYRFGPADFVDYLIGELNRALGCEMTLTFDRDAAKSPVFRHLTL